MASSANTERDTQLLSIGKQCSEPSCLLVDFLPFKCQHCSKSFCGDHFLVAAHHCPQYDESKHNRVAPSCPLCNTPVAIPPGEDPNIRMERHINSECSVMTGKTGKSRSQPVCARGKCGKVLYAPIACTACKKQFCPQHRFPKDHSCSSLTSTSGSTPSSRSATLLPGFKLSAKALTAQTSTTSGSSTRPLPASSETPSSPSTSALSNPFSKTDRTLSVIVPSRKSASPPSSPLPSSSPPSPMSTTQPKPSPATRSNSQIAKMLDPFSFVPPRAKAERESRRQAMLDRAKKGLLTEQEKLLLAEEEARRASRTSSKSGKDCTLM